MYYDQSTEADSQTAGGLSIGPFLVTSEQVIFWNKLIDLLILFLLLFRLQLVLLLN